MLDKIKSKYHNKLSWVWMKIVLRTILYPFALSEMFAMRLYVHDDMFVSLSCIFQIAINLNLSIYLLFGPISFTH